jgi:hypothetical protein
MRLLLPFIVLNFLDSPLSASLRRVYGEVAVLSYGVQSCTST